MTVHVSSAEDRAHSEDLDRLRTDFQQLMEEQTRVGQRRSELVRKVNEQIATLQRMLTQFNEGPDVLVAVAPVAAAPAKPSRLGRRDQPPILEFVREELTSAGAPIKTSLLKQALISRHGVPPGRLKNFSQLLYNASSVYKQDGTVGLVEWKQRTKPPAPVRRRSAAARKRMSDAQKARWARLKSPGKKQRAS